MHIAPSSKPPAAMPADCVKAETSTGSLPRTKRSVSASCTVMSSTTPPPASGLVMRQPCRFSGR
jgi:hypothetical protein